MNDREEIINQDCSDNNTSVERASMEIIRTTINCVQTIIRREMTIIHQLFVSNTVITLYFLKCYASTVLFQLQKETKMMIDSGKSTWTLHRRVWISFSTLINVHASYSTYTSKHRTQFESAAHWNHTLRNIHFKYNIDFCYIRLTLTVILSFAKYGRRGAVLCSAQTTCR